MSAVAVAVDPSTVPGGMERIVTREVAEGLIEFSEAPIGFLTQKGEPRKAPYRAYHWTPTGGKRARLPSTTTLLEGIDPKPGIPVWAEARGIEGLLSAIQSGAINPAEVTAEQAIEAVRRLGLGADGAKKLAASRGLNVHAINEAYLLTGEHPKFSDHPEHHHGYIRAWAKMILALNPEPVEVEQLVVHPEDGYAGRLDLRARIGGLLETDDFKTQEKAAIYPGAHFQVNLYERAAVRCGAEPASHRRVIVLAADGEWDHMIADHEDWRIDAALAYRRARQPIEAACESRNRREREARRG